MAGDKQIRIAPAELSLLGNMTMTMRVVLTSGLLLLVSPCGLLQAQEVRGELGRSVLREMTCKHAMVADGLANSSLAAVTRDSNGSMSISADFGEDSFKATGSTRDGIFNEQEAVIEVNVLSTWWETAWFRVLLFLALAGLIGGIFQWRLSGVNAHRVKLEHEINERKKSEEKFRTFVSNIPGAIYRCGMEPDWTVEFVNDEIETLTGYPASDFRAGKRSIKEMIHPDDRRTVDDLVHKALESPKPYVLEFRLIHSDGTVKWIYEKGQGVFSSDGELLCLDGALFDITERKRAEEALRESELRFELIADYTYDWESWISPEGKLLWVNCAVEKLTGYSIAECKAMTDYPLPIIAPADRARMAAEFRGAQERSSGNDIEFQIIKKDGIKAWIAVSWQPIYSETNQWLGYRSSMRHISERKLAEQKLRQSEADLRDAQHMAKMGRWELDLTRNQLDWSDSIFDIFEIDPENFDASYESFVDTIHPDDREAVEKAYTQSLEQKLPYEITHRLLMKDGRTKWLTERCQTEYDSTGKAVRSVGVVQDITDRKEIEEKIKKNQILLEQAEEISNQGAWEWDILRDEWTFSENWLRIYGCRLGGMTREELMTIAHPEDAPLVQQAFAEALQGGAPYDVEHRIVRQNDGEVRYVRARGEFILDESGRRVRMYGVAQDITDSKRAEDELQKARNYISNIVDSMPSVLIGVDCHCMVTQWNKEAERVSRISAAEATGRLISEVFPRLAGKMERLQQAIRTGEVYSDPTSIHEHDGQVAYQDITIFPLVANGVQGAVIRIDDVSVRYELEAQLNQARKMDAVGQLAGGIAHDFNNMLGAVIGAAELLQSPHMGFNQKGSKYVNIILKSATRAADLTAKLLAFGRKSESIEKVVDIDSILNDSLAILNNTIDKRVSISVEKAAGKTTVSGDHAALQNVIINLGINASHAMPQGGELRISTANRVLDSAYCSNSPFKITPGEYVEIAVEDTGSGIAPENLRKVYEPFFTTKEQGKGTGLGLAAAYGTVQNHHGAITVYSELGIGTVFHLYLPCLHTAVEEEQVEVDVVPGTGTILLVDDEDDIRQVLEYMLGDMGYQVLTARDGQEAVTVFLEHYGEIDVVVMDMIMPVMNGEEAFYEMRRIDPTCKVILASGFTKDKNLAELRESGLAHFIQKPYRSSAISQALASLLESK